MNTPYSLIAVCAGALFLGACDKTPTNPPVPKLGNAAPIQSAATAGPAVDPSLPSAAAVLAPANAGNAGSAPGRTDGTRNPALESTGTPLPGQNNDHSAPLGPAKPASSP